MAEPYEGPELHNFLHNKSIIEAVASQASITIIVYLNNGPIQIITPFAQCESFNPSCAFYGGRLIWIGNYCQRQCYYYIHYMCQLGVNVDLLFGICCFNNSLTRSRDMHCRVWRALYGNLLFETECNLANLWAGVNISSFKHDLLFKKCSHIYFGGQPWCWWATEQSFLFYSLPKYSLKVKICMLLPEICTRDKKFWFFL